MKENERAIRLHLNKIKTEVFALELTLDAQRNRDTVPAILDTPDTIATQSGNDLPKQSVSDTKQKTGA